MEKRKTCYKEKGEKRRKMNEEHKKEVLAFLIADAEKVLNIHDEGPLEDDFDSLKNYYTELEEKVLASQGTILDLSGKEIIPSESFFIVDRERDMIYPFSLNDIPILLSDGKNPYTNKPIDKEKIRKIQIVLGEQKSIQRIGGMLEVFNELDNNKPGIANSWEDIETDDNIERVRNLQQKAISIIESKDIEEMCKQIRTFTKEEVLYLSSPILWGIYLVCIEDKYPEDEETLEFLESKGWKYNSYKAAENAVKDGNEGFIVYLLGKKRKMHVDTILNFALTHNSIKFVEFSINNGAKIKSGAVLAIYLTKALQHENTKIIELLLQNVNKNVIYTSIGEACKTNNMKVLELLLPYLPDLDSIDLGGLLNVAVENSNITIAQFLLNQGADIFHHWNQPLNTAVDRGDIEMTKLLVRNGADISSALYSAVHSNNEEIVRFLLENGADDINAKEEGLIFVAGRNNTALVQLLLQYGADVHFANDEALLSAIRNDDLPMVKLLVQNGANLHARDFMKAAYSKEMKHYIKQHL